MKTGTVVTNVGASGEIRRVIDEDGHSGDAYMGAEGET